MLKTLPLLSTIVLLPLLGALCVALMRGEAPHTHKNAQYVGLWTSSVNLLLICILWSHFETGTPGYQFVEEYPWLPALGSTFLLGIDGISLPFVGLAGFLVPACMVINWHTTPDHPRGHVALLLILETFMIGTFLALDLVVFYIFFEGVLVPMYFIIGLWGGERRVYAAFKFFLYTLAGSIFMLIAIAAMIVKCGTGSLLTMTGLTFPAAWQLWLWLAFFLAFAVKIPMWPLHTWLPDAHVEAPTTGSVILAGVLLKMGGYGFLRFLLPLFPVGCVFFRPVVLTLSLIAVVYASLIALVQEDMKKLIAYSSIAHMGFVTFGIFTLNPEGVQGAILQMISHGVISSALFFCVGVVYEQTHTRAIQAYRGLAKTMPAYAVLFMLFMLGAIAVPGTSGFVAEFMVLLGSIQVSVWLTAVLASSMVLGAAYMLYLYRRVVFCSEEGNNWTPLKDISRPQKIVLGSLAFLILGVGLYPMPLLNVFAFPAEKIVATLKKEISSP